MGPGLAKIGFSSSLLYAPSSFLLYREQHKNIRETTKLLRDINVVEEKADLIVIPAGANIGEVVRGLNSIGATPRDLIAILQAIKAAGALKAELEII